GPAAGRLGQVHRPTRQRAQRPARRRLDPRSLRAVPTGTGRGRRARRGRRRDRPPDQRIPDAARGAPGTAGGADPRVPAGAARSRRRQRRRARRPARDEPAVARAVVRALLRLSAEAAAAPPAVPAQPRAVHAPAGRQLERGARRAVLRPGAVRARLPLVHEHDAERLCRPAAPDPRQDHGPAYGGPGRGAADRPADDPALQQSRADRRIGVGSAPRSRYRRPFMSDYTTLEDQARARIGAAADLAALEALRVEYLGKQGSVSALLKTLGAMSPEERLEKAPQIQHLREAVAGALAERKAAMEAAELEARLASERLDLTLPAPEMPRGSVHPVSQVMDELAEIFADL